MPEFTKLRNFSNLSITPSFSMSSIRSSMKRGSGSDRTPTRSQGQEPGQGGGGKEKSQGQGRYSKLIDEVPDTTNVSFNNMAENGNENENKKPMEEKGKEKNENKNISSTYDENLGDYWTCCQESDFSEDMCGKRNYTEVPTCVRCGHFNCDDCVITRVLTAPPKSYPKPKDPNDTLTRRASVSLKRASSILSPSVSLKRASTILSRRDSNIRARNGKDKEKEKKVAVEKPVKREQSVVEGEENEKQRERIRRISLYDEAIAGSSFYGHPCIPAPEPANSQPNMQRIQCIPHAHANSGDPSPKRYTLVDEFHPGTCIVRRVYSTSRRHSSNLTPKKVHPLMEGAIAEVGESIDADEIETGMAMARTSAALAKASGILNRGLKEIEELKLAGRDVAEVGVGNVADSGAGSGTDGVKEMQAGTAKDKYMGAHVIRCYGW